MSSWCDNGAGFVLFGRADGMGDTRHTANKSLGQSSGPGPRIAREQSTIKAMMYLYCQDHHGPGTCLCCDCEDLLAYALQRLEICPFQERKPACNLCEVHCYSAIQRERVKEMMRYAGPRMLLRHPVLALSHLFDKRRSTPKLIARPKR